MGINTQIRQTSLRNKVLIPFFAILIILGSAATIGTILIISGTLENTADERLQTFQHQIYSEIRALESKLIDQANHLEISYFVAQEGIEDSAHTHQNIRSLLQQILKGHEMTARLIAPDAAETFAEQPLNTLITLARSSGKPQFRFTDDIGPHQALTLIKPIIDDGDVEQFIFLQAPLNRAYLDKISDPLHLSVSLYDINGNFLVGSKKDYEYLPIDLETVSQVLKGKPVFISHDTVQKQRSVCYAIPLGTTDLLIVRLDMPLADITHIVSTLAIRSGLSILVAMLIGGLIYFRLISQILTPVQSILQATRAIGDGNLDHRIKQIPAGEFGELATGFNNMMQKLGKLYDEKVQSELELAKAHQEIEYKGILEEKNRTIEKTNRELTLHLKELSTLLHLNQEMASTLEVDVLFDRVIQALSELMKCNLVTLMLFDSADETLTVSHTLGIDKEVLTGIKFKVGEGVAGAAAESHQPIHSKNLEEDERYLNYKEKLPVKGSLLCLPLLAKGRLCGVLNLHHEKINGFNDDQVKLAQAIANQIAISIENSRLYELAKEQSVTDELTGLSNRRHFQDILQREVVHAQRFASSICLLMIDIDHFKRYNDKHGHLQGDVALKKVANSLLQNTRGIDLVARFGGEEFVVVLPKTSLTGARITAEKLREKILAESFAGEEASQPGGKLTISLGLAIYPDHSGEINELLNYADQALYQAKEEGRNRVVIWKDS